MNPALQFKLETYFRSRSMRPYWLYVKAGNWSHDNHIMHTRLALTRDKVVFEYQRQWDRPKKEPRSYTWPVRPSRKVVWHLFKFSKEEDRMIAVINHFGDL